MSVYGLILGATIENVVVCDTIDFANILWPNYEIIDITSMTPQPGIGWFRSGSSWINPLDV